MTLTDSHTPTPGTSLPSRRWWMFWALFLGVFSTVMDQSATVIALPRISEHFALNIPTAQWVNLGYVLSTTAMVMPLGRLSDLVGRKQVYVGSVAIFVVGALAAGTSVVFGVLLLAKVVQGIGTAGIQATAMAMITGAFPQRERGKALGLFMLAVGTGLAVGPVVGGVVVNQLGWRWLFYLDALVSGVTVVLAAVVLERQAPSVISGVKKVRFDWQGSGLSVGLMVAFLMALTNGHQWGWNSPGIVAMFSIFALLLGIFIWWELRAPQPMLDLRFFKARLFSMGITARFLFFVGNAATIFLMPFYLVQVLGYGTDIAGLLTVPYAVALAVGGTFGGRLSDLVGTRWLAVLGLLFGAGGTILFISIDLDTLPWYIVSGMVLIGLGEGLFVSPNISAVLSSQARDQYGIVSAFLHVTRTGGGAVGLAVAIAIVTVVMASQGFEPSLTAVAEEGGGVLKEAFVSGLTKAFISGVILLLLAAVVSAAYVYVRRSYEGYVKGAGPQAVPTTQTPSRERS